MLPIGRGYLTQNLQIFERKIYFLFPPETFMIYVLYFYKRSKVKGQRPKVKIYKGQKVKMSEVKGQRLKVQKAKGQKFKRANVKGQKVKTSKVKDQKVK